MCDLNTSTLGESLGSSLWRIYATEKKWGHEGWKYDLCINKLTATCFLERKYPGAAIWLLIGLSFVKANVTKVYIMEWYTHFI